MIERNHSTLESIEYIFRLLACGLTMPRNMEERSDYFWKKHKNTATRRFPNHAAAQQYLEYAIYTTRFIPTLEYRLDSLEKYSIAIASQQDQFIVYPRTRKTQAIYEQLEIKAALKYMKALREDEPDASERIKHLEVLINRIKGGRKPLCHQLHHMATNELKKLKSTPVPTCPTQPGDDQSCPSNAAACVM
jgi:hypothetical protein